MNILQKKAIAKIAYREVWEVMDKFHNDRDLKMSFHWDGCITVDNELFHEEELRDKD